MMKERKFETKVVQGGIDPKNHNGSVVAPIYQTSTFANIDNVNRNSYNENYIYSRISNPTAVALEDSLASLENGKHCISFSSGMAAIDCVVRLLKQGDEVLSGISFYGGMYKLFKRLYKENGIKFIFVDMTNTREIKAKITPKTKMVWLESPSNPTMELLDIAAIVNICGEILTVVDNTLMTPYLQRPLDYGADIAIHSASKYISGHSDVILGALICNDTQLYEKLCLRYYSSGGCASPFDSFLTLRGLRTLHLRMDRHILNARKIAHFLQQNESVEKVYWPEFAANKNVNQLNQYGNCSGLVSFKLKKGNQKKTIAFAKSLQIFNYAESFGGVESLISHPLTMSHSSLPKSFYAKSDITENLLRISVGLEHPDDLIEDLNNALQNFSKHA
jgi:cystathionine gamma-lyase